MRLFRVTNPDIFDGTREEAMDVHFAAAANSDGGPLYVVVGGRVAIDVSDGVPIDSYLDRSWLKSDIPFETRESLFGEWLRELPPLRLEPKSSDQFIRRVMIWHEANREGPPVFAYIVGPFLPLPPPPLPPSSIYGHLPFGAMTANDSVIYRWEAFPTSRRIDRTAMTIARDTYAAPSSEIPFAPTGFGAVARFALPSLLPACFRWELQPVPTLIECGASVPLHGQSGGGVEVRFPKLTTNRCPFANPVLLPTM